MAPSPDGAGNLPEWLEHDDTAVDASPPPPGKLPGVRSRWLLLAVIVLVSLALFTGFALSVTTHSDRNAPSPRAMASPSPEPTAASRVPPNPLVTAAGPAEQALERLSVKGRAPKTGYDRTLFGQAWLDVDRNGCDTRNDILRRDLTLERLDSQTRGCLVLSGNLDDPYTGHQIVFRRGVETSLAVQIDHVVALGDAWQKGASRWSTRKREEFANDPLELLAVDGPTNASKSDGDAATWVPPNKSFRCSYVARQIAVKDKYELSVTAAERNAMSRVLARCPGQNLPSSEPIPLG